MMNPHRDPSLHKEPLRLDMSCTAQTLARLQPLPHQSIILKDDADITNCCDQGSAMMQPLFPRSFLSWPKAKGGHFAMHCI